MTRDRLHIETGLVDGPVAVALMSYPKNWPENCGAESIFVGRTRVEAHAAFGPLLRLKYEVYEPMAVKLMDTMARDAAAQYDCHAVRMVHANGEVELGEASVVIQVATPHRGEGFTACRYLIDRLKHELPIWKHEIWSRGRTFVEGCCAHRDTRDTNSTDSIDTTTDATGIREGITT